MRAPPSSCGESEFAGEVTIVSDEVHLPYDRPPLSKDVLHREDHDSPP